MKGVVIASVFQRLCMKLEGRTLTRDDGSDISSKGNIMEPCEECARKGLPRFHSVTCEKNNSPFLEANAGSSLFPTSTYVPSKPDFPEKRPWVFGAAQDPRRRSIQSLNRFFLLARFISLAIDPLFFYVLAMSMDQPCFYIDGTLAAVVTLLRTGFDVLHLLQIGLQLKLAYVSKESLVLGWGNLVWDAREVASHYFRSSKGFWLDLFVILPIPQVALWVVIPRMISSSGHVGSITFVFFMAVACQYVAKIFHLMFLARNIKHVVGIVFRAVWWGFALNLTAYLTAGHVAGACWYLLASQRVAMCVLDQLNPERNGNWDFVGCPQPIVYQEFSSPKAASASTNLTSLSFCFQSQNGQSYNYGIYQWAVPLLTGSSWSTKILFPIFWGLMTLSSFGNALTPSDHSLEVLFSIVVITCGLLLFSLLIGNIQVFLHSITANNEAMKLRLRDLEHWMRRRQLPARLRRRVKRYERYHWAATRGVNEADIIHGLSEGLRRDIKQHLSLDLVRQVPLFEHMDNLVLKNICERLMPHLFVKDELVIREGDPVQRMLFIVRGHLVSSHSLNNGKSSVCFLGPGNFCGDELLTWCLKRPFVERLPPSFSTLKSMDVTEAFGLEAQDFKFVTEHFRYKFINESLRRTARYYSSGWRTWAAVSIQVAWRRYQAKKARTPAVETLEMPRLSPDRDLIRLYAAMFTSHKPQDNLQ